MKLNQSLCLAIIVSVVFSIMMVSAACAQTIHMPSVPEFTLKYQTGTTFHASQWKIDPYTGENITITPAYTQNWSQIILTIKNQPFTSFKEANGTWIVLYYIVASKGHYENLWQNISTGSGELLTQSDSEYTSAEYSADSFSPNAQVDFRVEAMIGYFKDSNFPSYYGFPPIFVGKESGWSNTQTITIPSNSTSSNPASTSSTAVAPTVPEFSGKLAFTFLIIVATAFSIAVVSIKKRAALE